ncbi:MAG: peptidoglycan DD-metalloendopeptidase family protein [Methylovirgula sp.]
MQSLSAYGRSDGSAMIAELGLEPAIEVNGERHRPFDRRRVSWRWLLGTVLTGLSGAALISAAIYAALDHQSNFAQAPSVAVIVHKDTDSGINPRKGDRLVKAVDLIAAKQTFKEPTTIKVGDREVVKIHTFTHVETTLLTASAGYADEVPRFNPLKLLADARNPIETPAPEPQTGDAEVSWSMRDLPVQDLSKTAVLSPEEVQAQVAETIKSALEVGSRPIALPAQLLLMRTSRANPAGALAYANPGDPIISSPFSSIEVRMVPENVTVKRRTTPPHEVTQMDERLVIVRHGETLEDVLKAAKVPEETIAAVIAALAPKRGQPAVAEGRRLKLMFADLDGSGHNMSLARLSVYDGETLEAVVAITDQGTYVRVNDLDAGVKKSDAEQAQDDDENAMRLYNSLYETALKQDIPRPIIDDMVRIFANDADLQRSVSSGDSFEALYDDGDSAEHRNELLYASLTTHNQTFRYYRFRTLDDGAVDFYDPSGKSSRKFLIRMPVIGARITSPFGMRYHPILGYTRMHTGTDFAASIGTPVFAAGNGTIISDGWDAGYGRRVEIKHANGYETTYNHLSAFARGLKQGEWVRQGQVIGYIGQSGLATGPHLHYEVLVNGHFVDPMKVKLAHTREIRGTMFADFKRERNRINALLTKAPNAAPVVAERQQK